MKHTALLKSAITVTVVSLLGACASPSPGIYTRQQPSYTDYLIVPIAKNHYQDNFSANSNRNNQHRIVLLYGQKATVTLKINEGEARVALGGKGFDKQIIKTKNNEYIWKLNTFRSSTFAVVEIRGDNTEISYTLDVSIEAGDQLENIQ